MARLTKAQREWRPGMPKKRRSTKVMFASTVLLLEAFVAIFATLAVFGLRRNDFPPVLIFGIGLLLAAALVINCAVLTKPWGIAMGWIMQVLLILTGILEPTMFGVGILFALSWWYGLRTGIRIDRESREREREQAQWEAAHPDGPAAESP